MKTVILLLASFGFFLLFDRADKDPNFTGGKQLLLFSVPVVFWLVFGTFLFLRTPLSETVSIAGVTLQIGLGLRRIRHNDSVSRTSDAQSSRAYKEMPD
jgi:hypothetical protein